MHQENDANRQPDTVLAGKRLHFIPVDIDYAEIEAEVAGPPPTGKGGVDTVEVVRCW